MLQMRNSQENPTPAPPTLTNKPSHKLYQLLYLITNKTPLRSQLYTSLTTLNSLLLLFTYLSMPQTALIPRFFTLKNEILIVCLFAAIGVILLQLGIGILYAKQVMIGGQFLVYRNVVMPVGFYLLTNWEANGSQVLVGLLVVVCSGIAIGLQWLIGKEWYSKRLLVDLGMPLYGHLLIFELSLYLYANCSTNYHSFASILMFITALSAKFVISGNTRRSKCLEYTLIKIQSNVNLVYAAFMIIHEICQVSELERQPYSFVLPLILFLILAQFLHEYSNIITPITPSFFTPSHNAQKFLYYAQYIADDIDRLTNNDDQDILRTCLIPIYYEHLRHCKRVGCEISHEFDPGVMAHTGHYKALTTVVGKITEQLFHGHLEILYENVELRIAFLNFYVRLAPSRLKIMQLIVETEEFRLSLEEKIKLYSLRRIVSDIDKSEFSQSRKVEDTFQDFNYSISTLMRLLIEFWAQFMQQRVDFQKVLQLAQKITPVMNSVQQQVQQTLETETISTIRTLKIYAEYARQIMNDDMKAATISDYTALLSKKMSEIHQINSITVDMEMGLIAISLHVKKLGEIKLANTQAAYIFNYNKQDFLDINVNQIMPSLIGKHHDNFLKVFMINENKKVNTDRRLLVGRKKQKFIFEIYLQLQKSIITSSEQLIFIANIELAKMYQANFLIICDDKGLITDYNSTYYQIFQKNYKKGVQTDQDHKHFTNIQELIPNFFQVALNDVSQSKISTECYDNPIFGILEVKFEITKLSFKEAPDLGYIIKGYRLYQPKQLFYNNISLTHSLLEKSDQRQLKGMKLQYDSSTNQYNFNQTLDIYNCGQFQSEYTIPYVKLDLFSNILSNKYEETMVHKQYDMEIKTLRYMGDHFERVEEPDSFESEITEEEKSKINKNRFWVMKEQLRGEEEKIGNKFPQILNIVFLVVNVVILVSCYVVVTSERKEIYNNSVRFFEAYQFRSKLAEYVLYFQAQDDYTYGPFFQQNKARLKNQLINQITIANLPQSQKQKALKVVYLEQSLKTAAFGDLINDETLLISSYSSIKVENHYTIFKILFAVAVGLKIVANLFIMKWHQSKTIQIFSLFLSLSDSQIKASHRNCVAFLKDSSDVLEKLAEYEQDGLDSEQQNPHAKIKRFKNISLGRECQNFLKLNAFVIVFFALLSALIVNDWNTTREYERDQQASQFMYTVMPEYSVRLMKAYSETKQGMKLRLEEDFLGKYQRVDYQLALLEQKAQSSGSQSSNFLQIMLKNQCINSQVPLPASLTCEQICKSVMTGGISKAINYLAQKLTQTPQTPPPSLPQLIQLSILLYQLIQPKIQQMRQEIYSEITYEYTLMQIYNLLYFIILVAISVTDTVYQNNYPLHAIMKSLVNFRIFINFLPEGKKKVKNGYTAV